MKKTMLLAAALFAAGSAHAKDKLITLAPADAALLKDKTIALTVHERPSFVAMTAGKATFGLFGVAAMVGAGNKLVDDNHVQDPAVVVREQLGNALQTEYGAKLLPIDATPTKSEKAKDLAALHADADYVLDVRSGGWNFAYFPTSWGTYWVGYSVQVQLVDAKTGRQVSNAACNANTHDHANPPSREELLANNAQLLKDVTTGLGWTCVQLLAHDQFALATGHVAATPAAFVDALAARTPAAPTPTAAATSEAPAATPAATGTEGAAAPAATPDAGVAPEAQPAKENGNG
ncbi:hypothetical protein [Lysobacter claricitrinus]|uniref:hypothetical protein n=1 Tax=Lysobacter claricitrinus TaxID=3367728 RepID=UPI0037DBC1FB